MLNNCLKYITIYIIIGKREKALKEGCVTISVILSYYKLLYYI